MKRLYLFLTILAALLLMGVLSPGGSGFRFEKSWNDQGETYVAMAASSPTAILIGLAIGLVIFLLPQASTSIDETKKPVGILRRLTALYLNMIAVMIPIISLVVLPILLVEASHTGSFEWQFYREYARGTDFLVGILSALLIFGLIFYYYYQSLLTGKPTVGQYLMGYKIVVENGTWSRSSAIKRMGWTLLTLCIWPITAILAWRNKEKAFWFDLKTNSRAMRFAYESSGENVSEGRYI